MNDKDGVKGNIWWMHVGFWEIMFAACLPDTKEKRIFMSYD